MAVRRHVPLYASLAYAMWETISNKYRSKILILIYASARAIKMYCISNISLDNRRMSIWEVDHELMHDVRGDRLNLRLERDIHNKSKDRLPNFPNPFLV